MLDLYAVTAFALLQILCSFQAGCLAALAAFAFLLGTIVARRRLPSFRAASRMFFATILLLVLLAPLLYHYKKQFARSNGNLQFTTAASADPLGSYLYGAGRLYGHLSEHHMSGDSGWEKKLFPGFLALGLAGLGAAFPLLESTKSRSDRCRQILPLGITIGATFVVVFSYILSLGPYLRLHDRATNIRMPFFWLRWIPGLAIFRVPARFGMLLPLGLAILAASGFCLFLRALERWEPFKRSLWKAITTTGFLIAMALEFNSAPVPLVRVMVPSDLAPEYRWLAREPAEFPLLELPITLRSDFPDPSQEAGYIYASIFHWHPLVNGYSSYSPTTAEGMFHLARQLPSLDSARKLSSLGVHYVVLHRESLSPDESSRWTPEAIAMAHLTAVREFGSAIIYELPQTTPQ